MMTLSIHFFPFICQAHLSYCPEKEKGAQERLVEPLTSLVKSYERGRESHARIIVQGLFEDYLSVEELFSDNIQVSHMKKMKNASNINVGSPWYLVNARRHGSP